METLTKNNRKQILGKKLFLDNAIGLIAKLTYIKGINYFDTHLNGKSQKGINAVIHINKFPNGIEIKLAKLFKYYSVGIQYNEIGGVFVLNGIHKKLKLVISSEAIEFSFNDSQYSEIIDFFTNELKIIPKEVKNENEFDSIKTSIYAKELFQESTERMNLIIPINDRNKQNNDFNTENENIYSMPLPKSTAIVILGVFSLIISFTPAFFLIGLILGIISLILSRKSNNLYYLDPTKYTDSSYKTIKVGKVFSIIGVTICGFWIIYYTLALFTGADFF